MDQWSSVLSSFGTLASLLVAVIGLIVAVRSSPTGSTGGNRTFRAHDASGARVTLGDNSPITDRIR